MAYSSPYPYVHSSPSAYLRDDLHSTLSAYAHSIPSSSTPALSQGASSTPDDRVTYSSPGYGYTTSASFSPQKQPQLLSRSSGSWYRSQSDPARYLPSWAVVPRSLPPIASESEYAPIEAEYAPIGPEYDPMDTVYAPDAGPGLYPDDDRPLKRARMLSLSPPTIPRTIEAESYAREPATLRKARSLRSDASQASNPVQYDYIHDYVPTRPSTPIPAPAPVSFISLALPPLPPPPRIDTPEDTALHRLQLLLEREARMRRESGLAGRFDRPRSEEIQYEGEGAYASVEGDGAEPTYDVDLNARLFDGAVEWILTVDPPPNPPSRPKLYSDDLRAQLDGPETPFFAAMLFRMYWVAEAARARAADPTYITCRDGEAEGSKSGSGREMRGELDGERELAFDYALAAVALAVKFDRDVLRPLRPVYARDFTRIAPHEVCFEELETAQWAILRSFHLSLALPMPGSYLAELRAASVPLRALVPDEWMWEVVVEDVWWQLGCAVREHDILRYPLSLLTLSTLSESLQRLTAQRLSDSASADLADCCSLHEPIDPDALIRDTGVAIEDACEVLGLKEDGGEVEGCVEWVAGLVREAEGGGARGPLSAECGEDESVSTSP